MEWITLTAPSVSEAKEQLLDKLGVPDGEAEFVVEDEGESKFFGLRKTEARVKARVVPKGPEPRRERKPRRNDRGGKKSSSGAKSSKGSNNGSESGKSNSDRNKNRNGGQKNTTAAPAAESAPSRGPKKGRPKVQKEEISMDQVTENMQNFLDGLTSAFGIDEKAELVQEDENLIGHIRGQHGVLIGPKARTLDAIQELTKIAAFKGGSSPARIKVDVGSYRQKRAEALSAFAAKAAEKAISDDTEVVLEPMTSADRKVVHDALSEIDGIETRSVGTDPRRRVVIAPLSE